MSLYSVILAGGAGCRFWPDSRDALPKQFLPLPGVAGETESLLQKTARRCQTFSQPEHILVATNQSYVNVVEQQLPWLPPEQLLLEQENKDTAPAIAWAVQQIMQKEPEATVIFLPADHWIPDLEQFNKDIHWGARLAAEKRKIVTIGIPPTYPATAYGYLSCGACWQQKQHIYYEGECFLEKPNAEKAATLLTEEKIFWNSGIYLGKAEIFWQVLQQYQSDICRILTSNAAEEEKYHQLPSISIDYGVMEKLPPGEFLVVPAGFAWDDVGCFTALSKYWQQDQNGNASADGTTVLAYASCRNLVQREGGLVALLGVDDLLVVEADGVLLIAKKSRDQEIKKMVELVKQNGHWQYV